VTELDLLPDVERLVIDFLKAQAEVTTLAPGGIDTEIPKHPVWPLLRVRRVAGASTSRPRWVDRPVVQVEAYGGTRSEAHALADTTAAVLAARLEGVHDAGVVTGVRFGTGPNPMPDSDYTPARPRWLFDVTVFIHPSK
jgi:hypothetical protein